MKIVTWNLNYDPRTKDAFHEFDWKVRSKYILEDIKLFLGNEENQKTVIFAFQEVMPEYMDDLETLLGRTHNIFAVRVHEVGRHLYTAIPKQFSAIRKELKQRDDYRDCWDMFNVDDKFWLINVHLPMNERYRLPISKHIAENGFHMLPSIIVGDFNTFSDAQGYEQMRQIQAEGFYDASSIMLRGSMLQPFIPDLPRRRVLETFSPYAYDVIPENQERYPIALDHIFVHGRLEHDTPICYDKARFTLPGYLGDTGNFGHSDHFAISMNIKIE